MKQTRKARPMFTVVVVSALILLVGLAGADLIVSGISPDELTRMGLRH
jgi:hypothetical protein